MLKPKQADPFDEQGQAFTEFEAAHAPSENAEGISDIERLLGAARRQASVFIVCCILGLCAGIGYVETRVPEYTATSVLLLDNRRIRAVQDAYEVMVQGAEMGISFIDTQVEVIKSEPVVVAVIDKLDLGNDPEFHTLRVGLRGALIAKVSSALGLPFGKATQLAEDDAKRRRRIATLLSGHVDVQRVPRAPILEVKYTSTNPEKAAKIANGFAEAYLSDQLESKYDAMRRASNWLQERMVELKQQVLASDFALQNFKAQNGLISSNGKLVNEQQLTEVNSQLVTARGETARLEARYNQIKAILAARQTNALLTEGTIDKDGGSARPLGILEQLRTRYVNAAKRESELASRLGPDHGSVVNVRQEMREYEKLMFAELERVEELYLHDLESARSREKSIKESLTDLIGATASTNKTLVSLRELERESDTYKTLYQSMLQRYQEVVQQQSFPITETRIIMAAQAPDRPSYPKMLPIIAVAFAAGGGLGACFGAVRELRDRGFRTGEQVREELGLEDLGLLPYIESTPKGELRRSKAKEPDDRKEVEGLLARVPALMRYVVDNPLSRYAEAFSTVKIALDLTVAQRATKKIGIVSVLPKEGKSTVAFNFSLFLAQLGNRTLLIDADLRNPELTRRVAGNAKEGLETAVLEGTSIETLLVHDQKSSLAVLPTVIKNPIPHTWAFLTSVGMENVLKEAEKKFDLIVFDLPPMGPVVDVSAFAPRLDAILFVVEWGSTARKLVRRTLNTTPRVRDLCLGVILNKVDMQKLQRYQNYGSKEYYGKKYAAYYAQD